ncbi:MAG: bacillithiol biosynthesis cysteine-adding enzyme BshC [Crocinitomicaceae bacterium]
MNNQQFSFDEFNASSLLVRSLINEEPSINKFSGSFFSDENIANRASERQFSEEKRNLLFDVLNKQNSNIKLSAKSKANISELKKSNAFTITTGHQLNMATGPLYTLYKILEVINWTEKLNNSQSENYYIPIFWMATEDHDFQEINHINLFGTKIDWEHESVNNSVVGRIELNPSSKFVEAVLEKFSNEELKLKVSNFLKVYSNNSDLASANRSMINSLFGEYGLVIIDGDDKQLKQEFTDIARSEIKNQMIYKYVSDINTALSVNGFHNQVYVRELNLFYIEPKGERIRIEKKEDKFLIKNQVYDEKSLIDLLDEFPERFSPNALLRPVYQELVLPNITYIGGGGEIAYWLQLKYAFEGFGIQFPLLKVRESVLVVDEKMKNQMDNFGYSILDLKQDIDFLIKDFLKKTQTVELSLNDQKNELQLIKSAVLEKALLVDKNATTFIESEFQRMDNQLDKMEKKFIASEKKNQEKTIKQLRRLQDRLYPNGGFQERHENYLSYIHIPNFVDNIKTELKKRMTTKAVIQVLDI